MRETGLSEAAPVVHPFRRLRISGVFWGYILLSLGIEVVMNLLGLSLSGGTHPGSWQATLGALLHMLITSAFVLYLMSHLRQFGLAGQRVLGTQMTKSGLLGQLPMLGVLLLLGMCAIVLIEKLIPGLAVYLRNAPVILLPDEFMPQKEFIARIWYNVVSVIGLLIFAPICEEILFRGWILQRLLLKWRSVQAAMWVSAVIFGLLHMEHAIGATCFALFFNALYLKTGSLRLNMALHSFYNLTVLILNVGLPKNFFLFNLPNWMDVPVFGLLGGIMLLLFWRLLRPWWPDRTLTAPLLSAADFESMPSPQPLRPMSPDWIPLAGVWLPMALGLLMFCQFAGLFLAIPVAVLLGRLDPVICGCLPSDGQSAYLPQYLVGFSVGSVLAFSAWLLCLRAYKPLPELPPFWRGFRLPAGGFSVLIALVWLLLGWRWLNSETLKNVLEPFRLFDDQLRLQGLKIFPAGFLFTVVILNSVMAVWLEQRFRQLISFRCRSLAALVGYTLVVGLLIHGASPVTTIFVSLWLIFLSLEADDLGPILRLQFIYNLLLWMVLLLPDPWLRPVYRLSYFPLIMTLGAIAACLLLLYRLVQARLAVQIGTGPEAGTAVPAVMAL